MMREVVLMIVGGSGMTRGYLYLNSPNWARLVLQILFSAGEASSEAEMPIGEGEFTGAARS